MRGRTSGTLLPPRTSVRTLSVVSVRPIRGNIFPTKRRNGMKGGSPAPTARSGGRRDTVVPFL